MDCVEERERESEIDRKIYVPAPLAIFFQVQYWQMSHSAIPVQVSALQLPLTKNRNG